MGSIMGTMLGIAIVAIMFLYGTWVYDPKRKEEDRDE